LANLSGDLCEGTGSNVFVVQGGTVMTPPLESGCLAGITRELVCEWTDVEQTPLSAQILDTCSEVFITSSTRDVHPVERVGTRELSVGAVTQEVRAVFTARAAHDVDP
jgi:branched-chain amino acid aminotransferase